MLLHFHFKVVHELPEPLGHFILQKEPHVVGRYEPLQLYELWCCGYPRLNALVERVAHLGDLIIIHLREEKVRVRSEGGE